MRKVAIMVALVATLGVAAVAYGQAQVNTYTVTASTSPTKAGTKKKPVPVTVNFNYTVGEKSGNRPSVIDQYSIFFGGLVATNKNKAVCTADTVTRAASGDGCPKGSQVGTGDIDATVGTSSDVTSQSIACHLYLTLYNGGKNSLTLFLQSGPTKPKPCPTVQNVGINAKVVTTSAGSALVFSVPGNLLHPVTGLDSAVKVTSSKVKNFFSSIGGCKSGKRAIKVTFHQATGGLSQAVSNTAKCTS